MIQVDLRNSNQYKESMEPLSNIENSTPLLTLNKESQRQIRSYFGYILLVSISIVILVLILIIYIFRQKSSEVKLTTTPVVPSQTENKTSSNEYIDENVQFRLRYPTNWSAFDPHVGSYPEKTWMVDFSPQVTTGGLIVIVTRPTDSTYPTSETWAANNLLGNYRKVNNNVTYIDNLQTSRFEDSEGNISTFFNTNDTLYSITLFKGSIHDGYVGSDSDYQLERTIYDDMLKSFKVGTKPPTVPTPIPVTRADL